MLRAIVRRKVKHLSGVEFELLGTIDFECPKLQLAIQDGGFGEDTYDVTELVGIECVDIIEDPKEGVQDAN